MQGGAFERTYTSRASAIERTDMKDDVAEI